MLLGTVESFGAGLAKGINGTEKMIEKDNLGKMLMYIATIQVL